MEPSDEAVVAALWADGDISWVLAGDEHQLAEYARYRAWAADTPHVEPAKYDDVWVLDWARRTGKTTCRIVVRFEDCLRLPKVLGRPAMLRYASAFQKNIQEIVEDVSGFVLETCPKHLRPEYKTASKARGAGFYFPEVAGGSVLRLVGLDKDPHGLRGRASDGDDLSEAAFIRHLTYSVKAVLLPQYQGRPWARLCLESSAPEEVDGEYDTVFVEDAKIRGAYSFATLDDNPRLSDGEREKFIREAGGRGDPVCEREYYGKRGRPAEVKVLPSFDPERCVRVMPRPEYALCYTMGDAGYWPDYFAVVWAWVDYERAKLCVWSDWIAKNAGTHEVSRAIRSGDPGHAGSGEINAFRGIRRWSMGAEVIVSQDAPPPRPEDGLEGLYECAEPLKEDRRRADLLHRPFARTMDAEPRLRGDLSRNDGLHFGPADNRDPDAQFHVLNRLFADDKIEIHPQAASVIAHCQAASRDKNGNLGRSGVHGHYDAMRCLAYLGAMVSWHQDPFPPARVIASATGTASIEHLEKPRSPSTAAINRMMAPRPWKPRRK